MSDIDDIMDEDNSTKQSLIQRINLLQNTISELQSKEQYLKEQHNETAKRETYLLTKLAFKDHTINELKKVVTTLKAKCCGPIVDTIHENNKPIQENNDKMLPPDSTTSNTATTTTTTLINNNYNKWYMDDVNSKVYLTDPAVNILFDDLTNELKSTKEKFDDLQVAYQLCSSQQPSDQLLMIKQLLTKCKLLQNENKYLVKQLTLGKNIKIEQELLLTKNMNNNLLTKLEETEKIIHIQDEQMKKFQDLVIRQQCLLVDGTTDSTK